MNNYENAEPKILKTLNLSGEVLDDSGNVIVDTSDYWVKTYNQAEPKPDKILHSDGTIKDSAGNVIQDTTPFNVKKYNQAEPIPAKYLHSDGTIDENPGSGGGGSDLEDNKEVGITENGEIEITPSSGYDGMKKVTATVNVSGGGTSFSIASKINGFKNEGYFIFIYDTDGNPITTIEDVKTKPLGVVCVMSHIFSLTVAISDLGQYFSNVQSNNPAYDSESDSLYSDDDVDTKIDYCGNVSNWTLSEELITKLVMDRYS